MILFNFVSLEKNISSFFILVLFLGFWPPPAAHLETLSR